MEIQINENPLSQPMNGQFGKSTPTTFTQKTGNELHTVSDPPPASNQMALVNPEYSINSTDWEYRNGAYWCPMEGCNFKTANKCYTAGHERTHWRTPVQIRPLRKGMIQISDYAIIRF